MEPDFPVNKNRFLFFNFVPQLFLLLHIFMSTPTQLAFRIVFRSLSNWRGFYHSGKFVMSEVTNTA